MTISPQTLPELDYRILDRELDRTKTQTFLGKNAAFLGPLMCSMDFHWDTSIQTACTNGVYVKWNPHFFISMKPKVRTTILLHELWHPARLDMLRCGTRDPEIWNYAADISINNGLDYDGYSFEGFNPWLDHKYDDWITEDIYDDLNQQAQQIKAKLAQMGPWMINPLTGQGDLTDIIGQDASGTSKNLAHTIINNVVAAAHSARLNGRPGSVPGDVETTLSKFLSPKLPWETILHNFFNELSNQDYSWSRPNRRYSDMYLPGMVDDRQGLDHLIYYLDVSGSISDEDIIRFHSEFKYVKDTFQPEKMTMVQFDTRITKEDVFLKEDPFEETHLIGRGGTSLICVREHILKNNPTAVVIFSDMLVEPMEPLPANQMIPIIWVSINNPGVTVPHGTLINLRH